MKKNSMDMMSNPLVVVLFLLVILIVILAVFRSVSPFLNLGFEVSAHLGDLRGSIQLEAFSNSDSSTQPVFVMYYANWCGHCKRTKPEFQKLMDSNNTNVKVIMIDCEAPENADLVKSQNIKGFPTIRYYSNGLTGDYEEYSGERSYTNFVEYLGGIQGVPDVMPDNAAPV